MALRPAEIGGATEITDRNVAALALQARLRRSKGEALQVLSEAFTRLRDEARNAKSRGDAAGCEELAALCEEATKMGASCLDEPGKLGYIPI